MGAPGRERATTGKCLSLPLTLLLLMCGCDEGSAKKRASEPPKATPAAVEAAQGPEPQEAPRERLGDVRVVRLPVPGFDALSLEQRTLLFYFQEALLSGRDIAYAQRFEGNLAVRRTLETVLETYRGNRNTEAFGDLKRYAGRFFVAGGIHHPVSGTKLEPGLSASSLAALVQNSDPRRLPLQPGQSVAAWLEDLTPILFSPAVAQHSRARGSGADPLANAPTQLYLHVTARQAAAFYEGDTDEPRHPQSSRLVERDGELHEQVYGSRGLYGPALSRVASWLKKALPLTEGRQHEALAALLEHVQSGDHSAFERYATAWHELDAAQTDLAMGFLDRSADPVGRKGAFAGVASFAAEKPSERTQELAREASALEASLPLKEGTWVALKGDLELRSMVAVLGGGAYTARLPRGMRLPHEPAASSRALLYRNVIDAYKSAGVGPSVVAELTLGAREQRRAREHGAAADALFEDLHAVLGHHLAARPPDAPDPSAALREHAAVVMEARADLIALYSAFDARLIERGMMPSFELARTLYDRYVRDALLTSLWGLSDESPPLDPGLRAARLVVQWARAQDPPKAPSVQRVLKEGETYFVIADYIALRQRFGQLLAELQRILAEGDHEAARQLVEQHADPVEPALRRQVHERLAGLNATASVSLLTPRLVADYEGETIRDVRLHYATDVLGQALEDSRRYALLPVASE